MTTLTNYMTVNKGCSVPREETEPALEEKIGSILYPTVGILGIAYQIYLLVTR